MKDIYLNSTSKDALIADLANVNASFVNEDGELVQASHSFAIDYIGVLARPGTGKWDEEGKELEPVEFYPGVHCNIRLMGDFENAFDGFASNETTIIDPKTPCRAFANAVPTPTPTPASPTVLSKYAFSQRFKSDEMIAILALRATDPVVGLFLQLMDYAQDIDLLDVNIQSGVNYLVSIGKLAAERAEAILTP